MEDALICNEGGQVGEPAKNQHNATQNGQCEYLIFKLTRYQNQINEKSEVKNIPSGEKECHEKSILAPKRSCYELYKHGLDVFLMKVSDFYVVLTKSLIRYPIPWGLACILVVCIGFIGFFYQNTDKALEELYLPQNSRAERELQSLSNYFMDLNKMRWGEYVIVAKPGYDLMAPDCVEEAKAVFRALSSMKDFHDICVQKPRYMKHFQQYDYSHNCSLINPLEVISDPKTARSDFDKAIMNKEILMSNGKVAELNSFYTLFGNDGNNASTDPLKLVLTTLFTNTSELNRVLKWEKFFGDLLLRKNSEMKCASISYASQSSMDDAVNESTKGDTVLVSATFALIIFFSCTALSSIRNPVRGHSLLAGFGILATGLSIGGGIGLSSLFGVPYISINAILPFLVLSIGVDDMFIIVHEFDKLPREDDPSAKVWKTMKNVGATITMTTLTDIVAFAVSMTSDFPAIRYFCAYAIVIIALEFVLQVTLFVIFLLLDSKRITSRRRDCLPICMAQDENCCLQGTKQSLTEKIGTTLPTVLMKWPSKIVVLLLACVFITVGVYGSLNVSHEFSRTYLIPDGDQFFDYVDVTENVFGISVDVSLVKYGLHDYSDINIQQEIAEGTHAVLSTDYYKSAGQSWLDEYLSWAAENPDVSINGKNFTTSLQKFLSIPKFAYLGLDIKWSVNGEIEASRTHVAMKPVWKSDFQRDAMIKAREELDKRGIDIVASSPVFIYFEQFPVVLRELMRNAILTSIAILVVTTPFCVNPVVILLLLLTFVIQMVECIGLMYFWGISVNVISMIVMVMSIGFTVDYTAHVASAFARSPKTTAKDRVIDALSHVGTGVAMGGLSTLIGMVVTFLGSSTIVRIVFRMLFATVLLGLFNGLMFLPVLFSIIWAPFST